MSTPTSQLTENNLEAKPRGTLFELWSHFLSELEPEFGKETIDLWLRSLLLIQSDEKTLHFQAKDSFQLLWFEEHVRSRLPSVTLPRQGTKPLQVVVKLKDKAPGSPEKAKKPKAAASAPDLREPYFRLEFPECDPTATFDSFIETEENTIIIKILDELCSACTSHKIASLRIAGSIAQAPAASKSLVPNPVYIWGTPGSGKTHLLQAVANRLQRAGVSVFMASSELFTEHVVKSIRAGEMATFRNMWRNVDALIVDDVHLFAKKNATQEEFFHTFNTLHMAGKQILLSSNCLPRQLQFVEPRLMSRFEWGIVLESVGLHNKQIPLVLKKKSDLLHFDLSSKQIDWIASLFPNSVRSSVRALEALILRSSLSHKAPASLSLPAIKALLEDLIIEEEKTALTSDKIISLVAEQAGIPIEEMIGKSQARETVSPRQLAMYLIRKHLKLPYMKIGDLFGRDHSTVMAGIRHIEKQISQADTSVGANIAAIEIRLSEIG